MTSSEMYDETDAERYDEDNADVSTEEVLAPMLDVLAELAGDGPALEFASGTGRVAVPLAARGVKVEGIELSPHMTAKLHQKVPTESIPVVEGDMATATAPHVGEYSVVFLVFNTISNLRTQAEQVECFRNAARHLRPGGHFVIELWVPQLHRMAPGMRLAPMHFDEGHLVFDTYDVATQQCASHHYRPAADGSTRYGVGRFRYAWPAECDLMAQLAGLQLESRWADWDRSPFTGDSPSHVSIWRKAERQ
ncbi:MAG: class I SAM-dependent methyltransferase [Micrococcales bacterium]|nr:class I SAM-dependent methyltransferase [Micrococcales bacterium]